MIEFPLTIALPLVAPTTAMLVNTPVTFALRLIGAAAVLNAVWKGPAGTATVGAGGSVVRLMVTVTGPDWVEQGPVTT